MEPLVGPARAGVDDVRSALRIPPAGAAPAGNDAARRRLRVAAPAAAGVRAAGAVRGPSAPAGVVPARIARHAVLVEPAELSAHPDPAPAAARGPVERLHLGREPRGGAVGAIHVPAMPPA